MKHDETMAKNQINLLSLRCWTSGEILWRGWQMVMKMVIIPCLLALFHKSECKSKSRQNRPLVCFRTVTEESKLKNRRSWVLLDRPLPTWPGRQAVQSDCLITIFIPLSCPEGGGGLPQKRELGGSQVRGIIRGQPYLTIPYINESFKIISWTGYGVYPAKEYIR
jgi:hypothetical protein